MIELVGEELTYALQERSIMLYTLAHSICERKGIILADTKFEFGFYAGELIIIDEIFTPDSSRYWSEDKYALDIEIDSMDKEPVRTYLAGSGWDKTVSRMSSQRLSWKRLRTDTKRFCTV